MARVAGLCRTRLRRARDRQPVERLRLRRAVRLPHQRELHDGLQSHHGYRGGLGALVPRPAPLHARGSSQSRLHPQEPTRRQLRRALTQASGDSLHSL